MAAILPTVLYKYLDAAGAKAFLARPQLQYPVWYQLDDLFEGVPGFRDLSSKDLEAAARKHSAFVSGSVSLEKVSFYLEAWNKLNRDTLAKYWREELEKLPPALFVCSTTRRPNSGPMWSQYGERSKGIVFGFSTNAKCLVQKPIMRIHYSLRRPTIPFPIVDVPSLLAMILTKSPHWKYQCEWRIFSTSGEVDYFEDAEIKEVILGDQTSDDIRDMALNLRKNGTVVSRIAVHHSQFRLIRERLMD